MTDKETRLKGFTGSAFQNEALREEIDDNRASLDHSTLFPKGALFYH